MNVKYAKLCNYLQMNLITICTEFAYLTVLLDLDLLLLLIIFCENTSNFAHVSSTILENSRFSGANPYANEHLDHVTDYTAQTVYSKWITFTSSVLKNP